jgi:hypothetical protein
MPEEKEVGLGATSRPHYAQSMYVVALLYILTTVKLITIIVNGVLSVYSVYLFQENKSYGSKKPFVFIL